MAVVKRTKSMNIQSGISQKIRELQKRVQSNSRRRQREEKALLKDLDYLWNKTHEVYKIAYAAELAEKKK